MSKVKKVWTDPVWSKLIAEIIKAVVAWGWGMFAIPVYALFKSVIFKLSFSATLKQTWDVIVNFLIDDFKINFLTIFFIVIGYVIISYLIKFIVKRRSGHAISSFNKACIWGADISWKWEKNKGKWEIKYGDYQMVCPKCYHNLKYDSIQGEHHLSCLNFSCDFRSGLYYYEPSSNVVILADMDTYYFHEALTSTVKAELRKRGKVI